MTKTITVTLKIADTSKINSYDDLLAAIAELKADRESRGEQPQAVLIGRREQRMFIHGRDRKRERDMKLEGLIVFPTKLDSQLKIA